MQPGRHGNHREIAHSLQVGFKEAISPKAQAQAQAQAHAVAARSGLRWSVGMEGLQGLQGLQGLHPGRDPKCRMQLGSDSSGG